MAQMVASARPQDQTLESPKKKKEGQELPRTLSRGSVNLQWP
jgi:hypothetical protein